jgi:DNA polymerase III epsilon subunit-like protein
MNIFFDTETTGIPKNYNAPISDVGNWPRLVQLGFIVKDDDWEAYAKEYIIKPAGFEIPVGASNVHGITTERALVEGVEITEALKDFSEWAEKCDTVIGHNVSFDVNVIGAEYWRLYGSSPLTGKKTIDTMNLSKAFVGIKNSYGFKYPKLHELYRKLFDADMGAAHTALQDIENTVKCYNALVERGVIK